MTKDEPQNGQLACAPVERNVMRFCCSCDYAMSAAEIESARVDFGCPRCGKEISMFYSFGSFTHRERREAWERGEIFGAPMPLA